VDFCSSDINKGYIAFIFTAHAWNGHISAVDLRTFSVDFFHRKSKKSALFLLPVYLAYWPRKRATCWTTHVDHFHQVWSLYDYPSLSYGVFGADTPRDLVTLTFWLWIVVKHGWSRDQPLHQIWRSYAYLFWLMSYDVRHRPLLTMRLEPLRMRRITWPVRRGQIFSKYLKSLTPICLFTMQRPRLYDEGKLNCLPK